TERTAAEQAHLREKDRADEANKARQAADDEKTKTAQQLHRAETVIYLNRIAEAHRAVRDRQPSWAAAVLNDCRWDLRHWEWGYLRGLCHPDLFTFYPGGEVHAAAFSPDGKPVAVSGGDEKGGAVRLCDVTTGREIRSLGGHASPIHALAFSADGKRLAVASRGDVIRP